MNVPKGYKMTEVGVIPEDWEVYRIGDIANVTRGASPRPIDSPIWFDDSSLIGWVRISDVTRSSKFLEETAQKLSILGIKQSRFVKQNSLIMSICATVGRPILTKIDVCIHDGFVVFSNLSLEEEYLYYLLLFIEKDWSKNGQIGSQMNLNTELINSTLIPIPRNRREQRSIARVLSDTDALINALDKLIAKKRDIKKAVMQELLTGKTRLPGFSGEWEVKRLGDIAEIISGGTPKTNVPEYWNGSIKWCTPTDITKCSGKYLFETERTISTKGLVNSSAELLPNGSLLLCSRATIGEIKIAAVEISTNQGFKSLVCKSEVSNEFLYYKLLTMKSVMLEKAIGSTFLELAKKEVASLEIDLPPLPEQQAIARVLSDTDALINALDKLIAKKRDIKKAVMQELLTGKTRLPGFSGEWEVKRLGDVASITMGQSPSSKYYNIEGVGLPLIQGNADIENRETVIRIYTSQITKRCYRNNIILSVRAPVGEVARATFDACIGRGVCAISYPSNFLYQYLMFSESSWSKLSKGSTFDSVNYKEISNFELYLPSDYAEQEAIAQVLSDIDSEITALEKRRDKMKALKQGMMQELLTGRIRLH